MAVDPNIKKKAQDIRQKIYGQEVRESLASGLESMSEDVVKNTQRQDEVEEQFQEVIENTTGKDVISAPEIIAARNGEANLKTRLDKEHQEVTAQLAKTKPLVEYLFEQNGGIPENPSVEAARNNTLLLRNLMEAGSASGGAVIKFSGKTFYFSKFDDDEIVRSRSGVSVVGEGIDITVLKCIEETSYSGGYSFFRNLWGIERVNYRDFTVDMYGQDMSVYNSGGKAFFFQKVTDSTFRDLRLVGTPSTAMGIDFLVNSVIDNVNAYECGRLWGVIPKENNESAPMFDPLNPPTHHAFPGGAGIGIGTGGLAGENFKITNCTAEKCGHYGIFVEHQYIYSRESFEAIDAVIANNVCRNNRFAGMGIRGGTRVQIVGNQIYDNGSFGLSIDSMGYTEDIVTLIDALVSDNIITGNGIDGVHVDAYCNISGLDVKNNVIAKNGEHGIALGKYNYDFLDDYILQENIHLVGNTLRDNGKGPVYVKQERVLPIIDLVIDNTELDSSAEARNNIITDDENLSINYSGNWLVSEEPGAHNGSFKYTDDPDATATFKFKGTGFKLIASTHRTRGMASVTIDQGAPVEVDFYADDKHNKQLVYQASKLPKEEHTVTIRPLIKKNEKSSGYTISIDAIFVVDGEIIPEVAAFEETDSRIGYLGNWANSTGQHLTNGTARYTNTEGSKIVFNFKGNGLQLITPTSAGRGIALVTLDGKEYEVDLYSKETINQNVVFEKKNLVGDEHTVEIIHTGRYRLESSAATVSLDQVKIFNGTLV